MPHQRWSLTPEEFGAALSRGLGRAFVYAQESQLTDEHRIALVEASLEPLADGYNWDDEMAPWLLDIACAAGVFDDLAAAVLQASTEEERDEDRVAALLKELACRGNPLARAALYAIVRRNLPCDSPTPGWEMAVAVDGPQAFANVGNDTCSDPNLVRKLVAELGDDERKALQATFKRLALEDSSRTILQEAIQEVLAERPSPPVDRKTWMRSQTVQDVFEAAKGQNCGWFRAWGKVASEEDLSTLADWCYRWPESARSWGNARDEIGARRSPCDRWGLAHSV